MRKKASKKAGQLLKAYNAKQKAVQRVESRIANAVTILAALEVARLELRAELAKIDKRLG